MADLTRPQDRDLFDEAGYLRRNPGLVDAIAAGIVDSAWDHYDKHGRREGRLPNDVDPPFYLAAYPVMAADLGRPPNLGDAAAHFVRFGRARGYLPNARAPRPRDPGAVVSPFGGGWTDRTDALDRIQGRFDLGRITDRQADRLRSWVRDGYVLLDLGSAADRQEPARLALEQAFAGAMAGALFQCPAMGADPVAWAPEMSPHPATALDIHYLSEAVRSLILAPPIVRFLTELFDSPLSITGSEGMLRPIVHPPRSLAAVFGHSVQRGFAGLWMGLDDSAAQPALHVYPGSHLLPEFQYGGRFKSVEEARRMGEGHLPEQEARHAAHLLTAIRRAGLERVPLAPDREAVVIMHPDLVHEAVGTTGLAVQRGIFARVCPRYVMPLYAERQETPLHTISAHTFSTAYYANQDPSD